MKQQWMSGWGASCGLPLLVAMLVLLALPAAAAETVELELLDGVSVSGPYITVADITRYQGGSEALWADLAVERLGYAPQPGQSLTLSAQTLLGRLADRGYDWRAISLTGPNVLTINGAQQSAAADLLLQAIEGQTADELGVPVSFTVSRPLPDLDLPAGRVELTVRFPDKPGWWLPDAVEVDVDGLRATTLLLGQYGRFILSVVVGGADGIPGRTLVNAPHVVVEEREVAAGQEVAVRVADVAGMTTRSSVPPGALMRLSRLKVPYDVNRGAEVILVISAGGVELQARAEALNNAYVGQRVLVERLNDGARFTGLVMEGPVVVVE